MESSESRVEIIPKAAQTTIVPSTELLLNQPIIIDQGSHTIKTGFAGSTAPKITIKNRVGIIKHKRVIPGGQLSFSNNDASTTSQYHVGPILEEHKGIFQYEYNMNRHSVINYKGIDCIYNYIAQELQCHYDEHPILLTCPADASINQRKELLELLFETHHCPAVYLQSPPSILSLYASGRTTGLVLDVGHAGTTTIPVYEGFALHDCLETSLVGGIDVTDYLTKYLLRLQLGIALSRTTSEWEICQDIKEKICNLNTETTTSLSEDTFYTLPDGQKIQFTSKQAATPPQVLFSPLQEDKSIIQCISNSISKADMELRPTLCQNILLAGGSTLFPYFGNRVLKELRRNHTSSKFCLYAPKDRIVSTFVGGSILASLNTFKYLWISREDYQQYGVNAISISKENF